MTETNASVAELLQRSMPSPADVVTVDGYTDSEVMSHAFWLNDLLFFIPPTSIAAQAEDILVKSQALRASYTSKIPSGKGTQIYKIDIEIPHKGSIVNVDWRGRTGENNTGKRGGLLDLIIQFKNIPFARIENAFIRSTLKIPKEKSMVFCLHNMTLNTVPGEPGNCQVSLIATVFNYSPYSPDWAYKDDWVSKAEYGGFNFSSVNEIGFGAAASVNRVPYIREGADERVSSVILNPWVHDENPHSPVAGRNEVHFNLAMTEADDSLWDSESHFMQTPQPVRNPALSSVFKEYIDWLHSEWHQVNDSEGVWNAAEISPYGSTDHDLGRSLRFKWREYKSFPMDRNTEAEVRDQIRGFVSGLTDPRVIIPDLLREVNPDDVPPFRPNPHGGPGVPTPGASPDLSAANERWYPPVIERRPNKRNNFAHKRPSDNPPFSSGDYRLHTGLDVYATHSTLVASLPEFQGFDDTAGLGANVYSPVSGTIDDITLHWNQGSEGLSQYVDTHRAGLPEEAPVVRRRDHRLPTRANFPVFGDVKFFTSSHGSTHWGSYISIIVDQPGHRLDGSTVRLAHLGAVLPDLRVGQRVEPGVHLALLGGTSISSSEPHLHIEITTDDRAANALRNPGRRKWYSDPGPLIGMAGSPYYDELTAQDLRDMGISDTETDGLGARLAAYNAGNDYHGNAAIPVTEPTFPGSGHSLFPGNNTVSVSGERVNGPGSSIGNGDNQPIEPIAPVASIPVTSSPSGGDEVEQLLAATSRELYGYEKFIREIESRGQGWTHYRGDLTVYNVFWREHEIVIECDSSSDEGRVPGRAPLVCTFISASSRNLYAQLPLNGQTLPTAQYLGKGDDHFTLSLESIGLNNMKSLRSMADTLKSQAKEFIHIKDAWTLRVDNNLVNAFGNRHFVIDGNDFQTVEKSPGSYMFELSFASNPLRREQQRIDFVGSGTPEEIRRAFVKDLLNQELIERVDSPTRGVVLRPSVRAEEIQEQIGGGSLISYLRYVCAHLNAINNLFLRDNSYMSAPDLNPDLMARHGGDQQDREFLIDAMGFEDASNGAPFIFRNRKASGTSYVGAEGVTLNPESGAAPPNVGSPTSNTRSLVRGAYNVTGSNRRERGSALLEDIFHRYGNNYVPNDDEDPIGTLYSFNDTFAGNHIPILAGGDDGVEEADIYSRTRDELLRGDNGVAELKYHPIVGYYMGTDGGRDELPIISPYLYLNKEAAAFARSLNAYYAEANGESDWHSLYMRRNDSYMETTYLELIANMDYTETVGTRSGRFYERRLADFYWSNSAEPMFFGGNVYEAARISRADVFYNGEDRSEWFFLSDYLSATIFSRLTLESYLNKEFSADSVSMMDSMAIIAAEQMPNATGFYADMRVNGNRMLSSNLPAFEVYLWEQVGKAYLINGLVISEIIGLHNTFDPTGGDGALLFPHTYQLVKESRRRAIGPCYKDITLPFHPYWNGNQSDRLHWDNAYTEPDFYMYNWGFEGLKETPGIEVPEDSPYTSEKAYNLLTQVEAEMSLESITGLTSGRLEEDNNDLQRENPFTMNGGPDGLAGMYQGDNMAFDMEFGFQSLWPPPIEDDGGTGLRSDRNADGTLRHSGIDTSLVDPTNTPDSLQEFGEDQNYFTGDDQLNHGIQTTLDATSQGSTQVSWLSVMPTLGANTDFPTSPGQYDNAFDDFGAGFWGFNDMSSRSMLGYLQTNENARPYKFSVENFGSDPDRFTSGNWGYDNMDQWSNTRSAIYGKVRDALKSIGRKKYVGRRAFPTFKIFFVEEDLFENGKEIPWKQIDDEYVYNQVESIKISDSRKRPASVATVTFLNLGGALDGRNMWALAQSASGTENFGEARALAEASYGETVSPFELDTDKEQNVNGFVLEEGTRIKIKLGTSNNPDKLTHMFSGTVTETQYMEEGTKITVVAQSDGIELVADTKGTTPAEVGKTYDNTFDLLAHMMFEPEVKHFGRHQFDTVSVIGENQSILQNQIIHRNTIGRRSYRPILRLLMGTFLDFEGETHHFEWETNLKNWWRNSVTQVKQSPIVGPNDDNLFCPNFTTDEVRAPVVSFTRWRRVTDPTPNTREFTRNQDATGVENTPATVDGDGNWEGSGREPSYRDIQYLRRAEIEYNIFYSTIWEIFDEMTLRHPGFVKHPRVYDNANRMTMFFGLPDQKYWAKAPELWEAQNNNLLYTQMMEKSAEVFNAHASSRDEIEEPEHLISGVRDAEGNQEEFGGLAELTVNAEDLRQWLSLLTRRFRPFRDWHQVNSTTDIVSNNIVANSYGFYTSLNLQYIGRAVEHQLRGALGRLNQSDSASLLNPNSFVQFKDRHTQEFQSQRHLSPNNKRTISMQFANCRGRVMAKRYGRATLARFAKEMYKGSIILLGNEKVKPYDVLVVTDTFNDIYGPVEVEEAIHIFTPGTGYVTEVIPDTLVIQEDIAPYVVWNSILPTVHLKTDLYMENALFRHNDSLPDDHAMNVLADEYISGLNRQNFPKAPLAQAVLNGLQRVADARMGVTEIAVEAVLGRDVVTNPDLILGGSAAAVGGSVLGNFVPGLQGVSGATGLAGAGLGLMASFGGASSILTRHFLLNYIANEKAFMMVPLVRAGKPWVSGYDMNPNNSMYRGLFDLMKRWWDDGSAGVALQAAEAAAYRRRTREFYGEELMFYGRAGQHWDRFTSNTRSVFGGAGVR